MAGMLPGVECARRRRCHQSGGSSDSLSAPAYGWTRRPSFCLYTSNNEKTHHITSTFLMKQGSMSTQVYQDDDDQKLGVKAREAKERLNERLRAQRKSESKRQNGKSVGKGDQLQKEVYGTRKSGSRRFSWAKLSWKASDQEVCAICLERFRAGENLVHLPCAHRFHHGCLVPWLENNSHCPCCRMGINVMTHI
ncbi:probable E3 ubiquitin-protein ligase RHY1A isoform X2 [Morus notabilis]|uniref:probable E3 ubiquitin-protein ligase RHY1A isoform X2 n=1 Tax=Morus notabilis TaxID=981085 RepID=UPI000CECF2A3|nr:probable E3 ubiquitin-protein ligase RHY1A isoform X2 [Morus notabilis]